jgi:hypothetical protein
MDKKEIKKEVEKEIKKEIGYDCSCCDFAQELPNKDLQNDFVYCCNPDCKYHYHVLFEHFRCKKDEDDEDDEDVN